MYYAIFRCRSGVEPEERFHVTRNPMILALLSWLGNSSLQKMQQSRFVIGNSHWMLRTWNTFRIYTRVFLICSYSCPYCSTLEYGDEEYLTISVWHTGHNWSTSTQDDQIKLLSPSVRTYENQLDDIRWTLMHATNQWDISFTKNSHNDLPIASDSAPALLILLTRSTIQKMRMYCCCMKWKSY